MSFDCFSSACAFGTLEQAREFYYPEMGDDEFVRSFCLTCSEGKIETARWMRSIRPSVDISIQDDFAFKTCCKKQDIEMIRLLVSIDNGVIKRQYELCNDYIKFAEREGNHAFADLLRSLNPNRTQSIERKMFVDHVEDCSHCESGPATHITSCRHQFCQDCMQAMERYRICCDICNQPYSVFVIFEK